MSEVIVVALISFCGTVIGSLGGIMASSKLSNYRIQQLEEKVSKHNSIIERTFKLEGQMLEVQHDIQDLNRRIG